jgi:hypothetical protein
LYRSGVCGNAQRLRPVPWKTPIRYPILRNIMFNHCGSVALYFGDTETARRFARDNFALWKQHWPQQPSRASGIHLLNAEIARASTTS